MIRVYIINKNEWDQISCPEELFSSQRREKMAKIKREDARTISACAESLLMYALRKEDPNTQLPLDIALDDRSKPQLMQLPYYFNLSHSGDYAACAISDSPVGVDIERFRERELIHPDRILHPEEAGLLAYISNPNEKKKYFYECWVAKESYLKNLGIGLIVRPRDFVVSEDRLKIMNLEITQGKGHHSARISLPAPPEGVKDTTLYENLSYLEKRYVHVLEPGEVRGTDWKFDASYKIAVCSMEKDPDFVARQVTGAMVHDALL